MADKHENRKKLCFVIGPIGDPDSDVRRDADWLLKGIIKPVIQESFPAYYVERADDISEPGSISSQVITRLLDAPLVIADMSRHNANAFYELAIRHMVGMPTIHMIHSAWKIPFDVLPYRAIPFSRDDFDQYEAAKSSLQGAIAEALRPDFRVENPITHARGRLEVDKTTDPALKVMANEMAALRGRVDNLDDRLLTRHERVRGEAKWQRIESELAPASVYLEIKPALNQYVVRDVAETARAFGDVASFLEGTDVLTFVVEPMRGRVADLKDRLSKVPGVSNAIVK